MHRRKKLEELNVHLSCTLCNGYFIDASTIVECLHSFCRSCLLRHLEASKTCPICTTSIHEAKPHLSIKPDKALQDIVYKLVPGLYHAEMKRRRDFYTNHPHYDPGSNNPEDRGVPVDRIIYSPDDSMSLSLEYLPTDRDKEEWDSSSTQSSESDQTTDCGPIKRYLQCPAQVEILHLKKFIKLKFDLKSSHKVELFYRKESLPDEYNLMDIAYIYTWKRTAPMKFFYRISEQTIEDSPPPVEEETTQTTEQQQMPIVVEASSPPILNPIVNSQPTLPQPVPTPTVEEAPENKVSVPSNPPQMTKQKSPPPLVKTNSFPLIATVPPASSSPTLTLAPKVQNTSVKASVAKNSAKTQGKIQQPKSANSPKNSGKPQGTPNSRQTAAGAKTNLNKTPNNSNKSLTTLKANPPKTNATPIAPRPLAPLAPKATTLTSKVSPIAPKAINLPQMPKPSTPINKTPSPPLNTSSSTTVKSSTPLKPPQSPSNSSNNMPKSSTNASKTTASASKNLSTNPSPKSSGSPGPKLYNTSASKSPMPNKSPKTPSPPINMPSPASIQNKSMVNTNQGTPIEKINSVNTDKKENITNTNNKTSSTNSNMTPAVTSTVSMLTSTATAMTSLVNSTSTATTSAMATAASITQLLGNRGVFASPSIPTPSASPASPRPGSGLTITPIASPRQNPKPPPPQLQPLRSLSSKPSSLTIEARPRSDTPKPQNSTNYHQNLITNKPKTQSNGQESNTSSSSGTTTPTHQQRHLSSGLFAAAMAGQRPDAKTVASSAALRLARRPGQALKSPAPPGATSLSTPPLTSSGTSSNSPASTSVSIGTANTQTSTSPSSRPITPKSIHQQIMRSNDEITAPESKRMKFTTVPQMRRVGNTEMGNSSSNTPTTGASFPVGKPNQQILRSNDQIVVPPSNTQNRSRQQLLKSNDELLPSYMRRQQANIQSTLRRSEQGGNNNSNTNNNNNHELTGAAKRKRPRLDPDHSFSHSMLPPKAGPSSKALTNSTATSPSPPTKDSPSGVRDLDFRPLDLSGGTSKNSIISIAQNLYKRRQQQQQQQQLKVNSPNNVHRQSQSPSHQTSSQSSTSQRPSMPMLNTGWVPPGARTPRPSPPDHPWPSQRPATANGLPN